MEDTAVAVSTSDFVQKDKLEEVLSTQNGYGDPDPYHVVIISGVSGAGKSEIALQVKKKVEDEHRDLVSGRLDCTTNYDMKNSLIRLAKHHDLESSATEDLNKLLRETCEKLKKKYPSQKKLLIFDDVEKANMLYSIDHNVCKQLGEQRDQWIIIVTTQKQGSGLYNGCDIIDKSKHEVELKGLADDEFYEFFNNKEHTRNMSEECRRQIKKTIGRLPVFLQVLRANLEADQAAPSIEDQVKFYLNEVSQAGAEDPGLKLLQVSFNRIIDDTVGGRKEQFKHMVKMLTTVGERRVTRELLIALAEVVLASGPAQKVSYRDAYILQRDLVFAMTNRSLCDKMVPFSKTTLFNTHNNIKLAMKKFREGDSPNDEAKLVLNSLIALTRVMPKDGREHLSINIFPYLYEHAGFLLKQVAELHPKKESISDDLFATIRLLTANLHAAMSYCQQTLKASEEHDEHFKESIDEMTAIIPGYEWHDDSMHTDDLVDKQMALSICSGFCPNGRPLLDNYYYNAYVDEVVAHSVVTTKDLGFMFESYRHGDDMHDWFANAHLGFSSGYLTQSRLEELRGNKKVLSRETMRMIYPLELLAEIYVIASKKTKFSGNGNGPETEPLRESRGEAALAICEFVTQKVEGSIRLMMEVVIKRELLKIRMLKEGLTIDDLNRLKTEWENLRTRVDFDAYDYGRVRTNFSRDHYHTNICVEHILCCEGRRFALQSANHWNQAGFEPIAEQFMMLIQELSSKAKKNHMTLAILKRNYAEFLFQCGNVEVEGRDEEDKKLRSAFLREAIQTLLDAFIHLRREMRDSSGDNTCPEVKSHRKADGYLARLRRFLNSYKRNRSEGGLLPNPSGENYARIKYVEDTCTYMSEHGDYNPSFAIMTEVADEAGINLSETRAGASRDTHSVTTEDES